MDEDEMVYCENGECRVESFHTRDPKTGKQDENCPDCGRFGRKKGK